MSDRPDDTDGDARFADVPFSDRPVRLRAEGADDVPVLSALLQDAVGLAGEISWMPRRRRFAMLVNRFRWEDAAAAERAKRRPERVRAALLIDDVERVRVRGLEPNDKSMVYMVLSVAFEATTEPGGRITIALAGDGDIVLDVGCIELVLTDLSRPWEAPAGRPPRHDPD